MADKSAIEWTSATWNPVTGCTRVSPGCANCYIERTPPFRMAGRRFERVGNEETTGVLLHPDRLEKPLRWRKPRKVFVCSLADLFHEEVPDDYIARVFMVMGLAKQHTFQVLTKRPERALQWFRVAAGYQDERLDRHAPFTPLPNVWVGVSIENARYTWRADVLRDIPAAVRFISAEPLLGSLYEPAAPKPLHVPHQWEPILSNTASAVPNPNPAQYCQVCGQTAPHVTLGSCPGPPGIDYSRRPLDLSGIDWLIAGGESGPGARPMHPAWARELRDACLDQRGCNRFSVRYGHAPSLAPGPGETAFFFKQWGEWAPIYGDRRPSVWIASDGSTSSDPWDGTSATRARWLDGDGELWKSLARVYRVGKKPAGRQLDGRTWDEYPETRP